ncbi:MAG: hypothetical protein CML29_01760 [Rhizobiales bacterium]|nr:hypothetical protein [Hyphomicrobiales bacterium]MBA68027.1 hypothetical protein [Hyphomicrobiales bacterium]
MEDMTMDNDLLDRLGNVSMNLHERARALSHPEQDHDMALLMSSQAICMEALRALGQEIAELKVSHQEKR